MEPLTLLQICIIAVTCVTAVVLVLCGWSYSTGMKRGREASARELDGLSTSLRLNASEWQLAAG